MTINDKCWHEALGLLVEHDSLTEKDFIESLILMGFPKKTIVNTLNNLAESPLAQFTDEGFKLDI